MRCNIFSTFYIISLFEASKPGYLLLAKSAYRRLIYFKPIFTQVYFLNSLIFSFRNMPQTLLKTNSTRGKRALTVTVAYSPEISGAGFQCKSLIGEASGERLGSVHEQYSLE